MATDFSYGEKQIVSSGPFKPSGKDMPLDARTRINTYSEKETIPNPFVGMIVTVLTDENNNDEMQDYKVKSLKANSAGIANMVIDEMIPYVDYLGVSGGSSGGGSGLTATQLSNIAKIPAIQSTVDALPNNYASKDHNHSEYASSSHRHDASEIDNLPSGGGGSGLTSTQLSDIAKIPAIQSTVDALPNNYASKNHNHSEYASSSHRHDASEIDNLPSGGGTGLTTEQAQQLQTAYEHSQSTHVQQSDIPTKLSKLENDSNFANQKYVDDRLIEISTSGVITEDAVDSDIFIAGAFNNPDIVTDCLEGWWTPAVKINQTLYDNSGKSRNITYPDNVKIENNKLSVDENGSANVEIDIEPTEILTIEYVINLTNQTNGTAIGTYYFNKSAGMSIRVYSGRWLYVEVGYDSTSEGEAIDNKVTYYSNNGQTNLWNPASVGIHHILIRYNSELSRLEIFIDGQLSTAYKDLVGKKTPIFNVSKVGFNTRGIGLNAVDSVKNIEIYDMKMYSKMLSDEEVTKNYNSIKHIIEGQ